MSACGSTCLVLTLTVFAACYSPEVRDCAVTCGVGDSCPDDTTCSAEGFCRPPGVEGSCWAIDGGAAIDGDVAAIDADSPPVDAPPVDTPDAMAPGDAPGDIILNVAAQGQGRVRIPSEGLTCNNSCQYTFPGGTQLVLVAEPNNMNIDFDEWTGDVCVGQPAQCTFTLQAPSSVTASFSN